MYQNTEFFAYEMEITGTTVSLAPEASTWAMMGVGFAALGLAGYSSRRRGATA